MPDVPVGLVGGSGQTWSEHQTERLVNGYLQFDQKGKKPVAIIGSPGLSQLISLGGDSGIRGMYVFDGRLFVVNQTDIREVYSGGTSYLWANLNTLRGPVGISENNGKLIFGDGTGFYVLDLSDASLTVVLIEGTDELRGTWSEYIDGYTLYMERDTGQVWYSDIDDPETVGGLSFGAAEGSPDINVNIAVIDRRIILFQTNSVEHWDSTGDTDDPFARVSGGFVEGGCAAARGVVEVDNSVCWIGSDEDGEGIILRMSDWSGVRISNHAVEKALRDLGGDLSGVTSYSYQEDGHTFACWNIGDLTWCYDFSAPADPWSNRGWTEPATGAYERQRQDCHAFVYGAHYVGDYESGKIYRQALGIYSDNGDELVLERVTPHQFADGRGAICDEFEVFMETGVGLDGTGQGTDPVIMLQYSTDGGRNYSNEITRSIGQIGETRTRVRFHRLGSGRDWVLRLRISDPVRRVITGGVAKVRLGR